MPRVKDTVNVNRNELDRVHRVGKPNRAEGGAVNQGQQVGAASKSLNTRPMIVKLIGHQTKLKFMKVKRSLKGRIFINEDLTKVNYNLLMYVKQNSLKGVVVYTMDGTIMARSPTTEKVYRIKKKEDLVKFNLLKNSPPAEDDD